MKRTEKLTSNLKNKSRVVHERTYQDKDEKHGIRLFPFFIFILFVGLLYLLFFSGAFNVKNIKVRGYSNPALIEEVLQSYLSKNFLNNNIILFRDEGSISAIKGDSGVRSVKIIKIYPDTLVVEVEESSPVILWNSKGDYFEIDERGYVIGSINNKDLPIVYDLLNIELSLGERVASPTFINYIVNLDDNFNRITGSEIDKIFIYDILSDVRVKSTDSWTAYFNSSKDPVAQLENLNRILIEVADKGKLNYIDMRLEKRIFYK